jgi:hypothetical protein
MQKESLLFFLFPSGSIFGEAQDTKKRVKYKKQLKILRYSNKKF